MPIGFTFLHYCSRTEISVDNPTKKGRFAKAPLEEPDPMKVKNY